MAIKLGMTAKDKITGFQGVVVGLCQYLTDCSQALITPKCDEKMTSPESRWIDLQRLEQVGTEVIKLDNGETPGCDKAPPVR